MVATIACRAHTRMLAQHNLEIGLTAPPDGAKPRVYWFWIFNRVDKAGMEKLCSEPLVRPRFFERATPNQMWQTDIFTFRLGGRYAYLIGFMDDYSRFMVGADLFRSHTAENVLEVFCVAAAEYQSPNEMLTDNGREYINWRGTTRFQAEMKMNGTHK